MRPFSGFLCSSPSPEPGAVKTTITGAMLVTFAFLTGFATPAFATPSLQLDIIDGFYDPVDQTTISTSRAFTLKALMIESKDNTVADWYYVSAALTPKTG